MLRQKEGDVTRSLRARVAGGLLVPLEPIGVPDGSEIELTMEMPERAKTIAAMAFGEWDLGVCRPLTCEDIYDNV